MTTLSDSAPERFSEVSMEYRECPKCGATWINGEHRWRTGCVGSERTLSNLVCRRANDDSCINPQKKTDSYWLGYDTWEKREEFSKKIKDIIDNNLSG